jgi:plasmid stability protein
MTLRIDLPEDKTAALAAKARTKGLSAEQYAREVLEHDLEYGSGQQTGRDFEYHQWPLGVKREITRKEIYDNF